jgi:methyl-accepting chemotaxis protein
MSTVIIVLALLAIGVGSIIYLTKKSIIKDSDGDFIPDVVEEKVEEVKKRVERVKEEISDVVEIAKELTSQVKDVAEAANGKSKARKGRKPAPKK